MIKEIEAVMAKVRGNTIIDQQLNNELLLYLSRYKLEYQAYNDLCFAIKDLGFRVKVENPEGPKKYRPLTDYEKMDVLYIGEEEIARERQADGKNIQKIAMAVFRAHYIR